MKKKLFEILPHESILQRIGTVEIDILSIEIDSRKCTKSSVFVAFKGTLVDGHHYIEKAIDNGAIAVVCEVLPLDIRPDVTYILVADARTCVGIMCDIFYNQVSNQVKLVGITGTNGKTTVATLLFKLFTELGYKCGLISTVENKIGHEILVSSHTTPDVVSLHRLLYEMKQQNCSHIFMEVSSHAVDQRRIAGLKFAGAVFTNISHDHLDYHKTMDQYIDAKKKFFDHLDPQSFALVNVDDKRGMVMVQNTKASIQKYSLRTMADYKGKVIESNVMGLLLNINGEDAFFKLIGNFNAYNLLAVYGTSVLLGMKPWEVLTTLSGLDGPEGRFEQIIHPVTKTCGIVDYAHSPDALENVLSTIQKVKNRGSQIITVVGCGGDRDKSKRPEMAKTAVSMSDKVVLTSDNPRSEDPEKILDEMEAGIDMGHKNKVLRITDRSVAIKTAIMISKPGDIILIAGKGHEKYQEIKGEKFPFDDKKLLAQYLLDNN